MEAGSSIVQQMYHGNDEIIISELATIECLSTIHRKYRTREISHAALTAIIEKFEADLEQRYSVLRFSLLVISEAQDMLYRLAKTHGLKTLDSLQFAFFVVYCDATTRFVCADTTLGNLVKQEGYQLLAL